MAEAILRHFTQGRGPMGTLTVRWDTPELADVVAHGGDVRLAFEATYSTFHARIHKFLALPFERLDDARLLQELAGIGRLSH